MAKGDAEDIKFVAIVLFQLLDKVKSVNMTLRECFVTCDYGNELVFCRSWHSLEFVIVKRTFCYVFILIHLITDKPGKDGWRKVYVLMLGLFLTCTD